MTREEFLKNHDFMKVGMAVSSGNFNMAMMIVKRMRLNAAKAGVEELVPELNNLEKAIMGRNVVLSKNVMAVLVAKRAELMKNIVNINS